MPALEILNLHARWLMDSSADVSRLLAEASKGDVKSAQELLPLVYEELRRMASYYFRRQPGDHTLQPTALVNEAFLKLAGHGEGRWENRTHFLAVAATAMRHVLVNHALARKAEKRGGGCERIELDRLDGDEPVGARPVELDALALHEILTRLADIDARKHRIVELRFFAGLSMEEIAQVMELSKTTVETEWRAVRAW